MSLSAASRSNSRVKQWQCTIGITSYSAFRSVSDTDGDDDCAKMPRNAWRNVIAESGRFMTKCAMRLRGGSCKGGINPRDCSRESARRCDCDSGGPIKPGRGFSATRIAACRMNSCPSSHDGRTRSETYQTNSSCESTDVNVMGAADPVIFNVQGKILVTIGIQIIC